MNDDYNHNRRTPLTSMAHYEQADEEPADTPEDEDPQAPEPLTVLVVDRRGAFSADIERAAHGLALAGQAGAKVRVATHPTRLLEQVEELEPDVVLASPEEMTSTGLRRLSQVHRAWPRIVIALTQVAGAAPVSLSQAAACGASEVLAYPATALKLRNALGRILAAAQAQGAERVVIREVITPAPPAPVLAPLPPVHGNARVFTVTSPTGGCGKTFFATNLAAYLAGATGGRVLLVDLDLQFGEVSLALGLRPKRTISELINEESLSESFPDYVVEHSAGYAVLSAPADPFAAELVGPREATQVLEAARKLYDYVVVDTPPSLNEVVLAAFDQSRYLVVMATMDVPSLRNLKVFLETVDRLKLPVDDVSCVLNKAEPDNGIDLAELLRVYPGGFAAVLPYAKEVSRSLNVGKPVLMTDPRSEISQKILEAGAKLVPASEVTNPSWGTNAAAKGGLHVWGGRRKAERASQGAQNHGAHTDNRQTGAPQPSQYPQAGLNPAYAPAGPPDYEPVPAAAAWDVGPTAWGAAPAQGYAPQAVQPYPAPQNFQPPPAAMPSAPPAMPQGTGQGMQQGLGQAPFQAPAPAAWGPPPERQRGWLGRLLHYQIGHKPAAKPAAAPQPGYPTAGPHTGAAPTPAQPRPQTLVFAGSRSAPEGTRRQRPDESTTPWKEQQR